MSNISPLTVAANKAAEDLKPYVGLTASAKYPYLYLPQELECVANLRDRWLEVRIR
jgi:hypothetical protein